MDTSRPKISVQPGLGFFRHLNFVIRYVPAHRFRVICLLGLFATVVVWVLPARYRPYRISRDFDDFKILFVERDSEWGCAANGLVRVHTTLAFGGTRKMLEPVREDWIHRASRVKTYWPAGSNRPHYDEWGPDRLVIEDQSVPLHGYLAGMPTPPAGVEITQYGHVYCLPYSFMALGFCVLLIGDLAGRRWLRISRPRQALPRSAVQSPE